MTWSATSAVVAHIDAARPRSRNWFLFHSGKIHKVGEVHDGETEMDWMDQERERGVTITAAATTFEWKKHEIISRYAGPTSTSDRGRAARCACSTVPSWCSAASPRTAESETVWHQADKFKVPRLAFITASIAWGASFPAVVADIRERLGANAVPDPARDRSEENFAASSISCA